MAVPAVKPEVRVKNEWCKGCGICVGFCPKGVLKMNEDGKAYVAHPELCVGCNKCQVYCPDFAIALGRAEDGVKRERNKVNAR